MLFTYITFFYLQFLPKKKKSSVKVELVENLEIATLFRIKKSLLPEFKKEKFVYTIESIQNGKKNNVDNNCMLISVKDAFVAYYYELKAYNNNQITKHFYKTLLMFHCFLEDFDKGLNKLNSKNKKMIKNLITHPEDFNKILNKIISKIEYLICKKYNHGGGTNPIFIMMIALMFNLVLLKNN